ncbi:hypothetical protein MJD09_21335 [bacterium]|nr:hypothetical protein [bacterium]
MQPAKLMTPSFVFQDHRGIEARRSVGLLPSDEFKSGAVLRLGTDRTATSPKSIRFRAFGRNQGDFPDSHVAPEANFWAGVGLIRQHGGDKEVLRNYWE